MECFVAILSSNKLSLVCEIQRLICLSLQKVNRTVDMNVHAGNFH